MLSPPFESPEEPEYDDQPPTAMLQRLQRKYPEEFEDMVKKYRCPIPTDIPTSELPLLFHSFLSHRKETVSGIGESVRKWRLNNLYRYLIPFLLHCKESISE